MQFSKNTSSGKSKTLLIKLLFIIAFIISAFLLLGKVDFPSPNKEIEKTIPNEKLKIVK